MIYENIDCMCIDCCVDLLLYQFDRDRCPDPYHHPSNQQRPIGSGANSSNGIHFFNCYRDHRLSGSQKKRIKISVNRLNHLKSRKDARLVFRKDQNVVVRCMTNNCNFDAHIQNVSSSGIFISTNQHLPIGEEIAVSFTFPDSGHCVKATGKVVRVTNAGIGVELRVNSKEKAAEDKLPQKPSQKATLGHIFK
jgi:Tfp pilus assembly protein PilZ